MINKKIAIEPNLSPIRDFLANKGFQVETIEHSPESARYNSDEFAAIVVTGQNKNFLGIKDTDTKTPVINASGLTPQEVFTELQNTI